MEPTTISYGRGGVMFVIITQNSYISFGKDAVALHDMK